MVRHSSFLLQPSCNSDESSIVLVPLVQAGYGILASRLVGKLFKISYLVALSILIGFEELANVLDKVRPSSSSVTAKSFQYFLNWTGTILGNVLNLVDVTSDMALLAKALIEVKELIYF